MAINRYQGNTGKVIRMEEPSRPAAPASAPHHESPPPPGPPEPQHRHNPGPQRHGSRHSLSPAKPREQSKIEKSLGGLLQKLDPSRLEFEDILLMMILFLLYRESGDEEMLIMMGALFLL